MESFYGIHCTLNLMLLIFLVLLLEPCFDISTVDTAVLSSLSYLETKILNRLNPIFPFSYDFKRYNEFCG